MELLYLIEFLVVVVNAHVEGLELNPIVVRVLYFVVKHYTSPVYACFFFSV
jgi:hypothetical protein